MRVLFNVSGLIGRSWTNGAFVRTDAGDVLFAQKVGVDGNHRWVPNQLPTLFRSQLDVNGTAAAMGARVVGGVASDRVIGGHHAVAWKGDSTLAQLVEKGKLTVELVASIDAYYAPDLSSQAAA